MAVQCAAYFASAVSTLPALRPLEIAYANHTTPAHHLMTTSEAAILDTYIYIFLLVHINCDRVSGRGLAEVMENSQVLIIWTHISGPFEASKIYSILIACGPRCSG